MAKNTGPAVVVDMTEDDAANVTIAPPYIPDDEPATEGAPQSYVPAVRSVTSLAQDNNDNFGAGGDFAVQPPWLSVVHGVGKLAEAGFNPGSLVLASEHLLAEKGSKLTAVIVAEEPYFKQYLSQEEYAAGVRPRTFKSKADALAAGMTTEWSNGVGPNCSHALDLFLLIQKPKDLVCGLFGLNIGGQDYAPALLTLDKKAYWASAPGILQTISFSLRARGRLSGVWELYSEFVKSKKDPKRGAWVPRFRLVGYNNAEFVQAAKAALGMPAEAAK